MRKISPLFLISISLCANPTGATVVQGEVQIETPSPEHLQIKTGDQAIIDWHSFSIDVGEKTEFIQPRIDSVAINRVIDADPSRLMGELYANGAIVLINPNGIVVGKDAVINTASLIASTLDLNGDLYLQTGELAFQGDSGAKIIHEGTIRVQEEALLIGREVESRGTIVSSKLAAVIAANHCLLKPVGDRRIFVRPAEGVKIEEGNAFASAFRHATCAQVAGKVAASEIYVRGTKVCVDPGAEIVASASGEGDGGSVRIEGEEAVCVLGQMAACGGANEGDGGTIRIASQGNIEFDWKGDLSAPFGKNGTLFFEGREVFILPIDARTPVNAEATRIDPIHLSNFLQSQGKVEIRSLGAATVLPDGNIIWTSPNGLTFAADGELSVHANIQNAGVADITLVSSKEILIAPGNASVSVGSAHGQTVIGSAKMHAPLEVLGGNGYSAQVGFYTTTAHCTGPISIHCDSLTVAGASQDAFSGAQIGHGAMDALCGVTTSESPILITASGDISIQGGSTRSPAQVGHGGLHGSCTGPMALEGEIAIRCGGDLKMGVLENSHAATLAAIGHGFAGKMLTRTPLTYAGNVSVEVGGDVRLSPAQRGDNAIWIAHHAPMGGSIDRAAGNIDLTAQGSLVTEREGRGVFIGHFGHDGVQLLEGIVPGVPLYYHLAFAKDVHLPDQMVVGFNQDLVRNQSTSVFRGDVEVVSGGALHMSAHIGARAGNESQTRTFVVSGDSMVLRGAIVSSGQEGSVQIAALRDIDLEAAAVGAGNGITRIYAGGSVRGTPGKSRIGCEDTSLFISAGGDIALPSDFETKGGSIGVTCGRDFKAGGLWECEGGQLVSIGGQAIQPMKTFLSESSPTISGLGSYTNRSKVTLTTETGDLILTCGNFNAEHRETLRIGQTADAQFTLKTTRGNIHLGPFYDVVIDQPLATKGGDITVQAAVNVDIEGSLSTDTGLIYLSAGNNLTVSGLVTSERGKISTFSGNDTVVRAPLVSTAGEVLMIAGRHLTLKESTHVRSTDAMVTLVVDYAPPEKPLLNPGVFIAEAGVRVDSGANAPLRIFTAATEILEFNQIDPSVQFNGRVVGICGYPTQLFENTGYEVWLTRFEPVYPYPGMDLGRPFTIFYKYDFDFLNDALRRAQMFTSQAHPGLFSYPQSGRRLNVTLLKNTRFPEVRVSSN